MTHPRHLDARYAMAKRLSEWLYANSQSADFLKDTLSIEFYWRNFVCRGAGESHVPSLETRELIVEAVRDLEAKNAPKRADLRLPEFSEGSPNSSALPTPGIVTANPGGSSDPSEAPQDGKLPAEVAAAPSKPRRQAVPSQTPVSATASDDTPARVRTLAAGPGGQVSLLPPHQKHSETSRTAARSIAHETAAMRLRVLQFFREHPDSTDEEMFAGTGLPQNTARPRRVELLQRGTLRVTGKKVNASGRKANCYAIREASEVAS